MSPGPGINMRASACLGSLVQLHPLDNARLQVKERIYISWSRVQFPDNSHVVSSPKESRVHSYLLFRGSGSGSGSPRLVASVSISTDNHPLVNFMGEVECTVTRHGKEVTNVLCFASAPVDRIAARCACSLSYHTFRTVDDCRQILPPGPHPGTADTG